MKILYEVQGRTPLSFRDQFQGGRKTGKKKHETSLMFNMLKADWKTYSSSFQFSNVLGVFMSLMANPESMLDLCCFWVILGLILMLFYLQLLWLYSPRVSYCEISSYINLRERKRDCCMSALFSYKWLL